MENQDTHQKHFKRGIEAYRQAERWLYTLIKDPSGERYFQQKSMEVRMLEFVEQIERTQAFMDFWDNPEKVYPIIHVAGTSGKGSVVRLISGLLSAAGLRVGYHVSPYLQVCNEKLIVDNRMISPSGFVALVEDFKNTYQEWLQNQHRYDSLKYGEAWVAMTLRWMATQQVDWAVIETGLGGRYDPTNIVPSQLAVITNVHYDHIEVLGEELTQIAGHKAGIIKTGSLAITAETNPEALAVIKAEAEQKKARLFRLGHEFDYQVRQAGGAALLSVQGVYHNYENLRIAMSGEFQQVNAALAVASVDLLAGQGNFKLSQEQVRQGVAVKFPGRFEIVQEDPLVILDGAHNQHKAAALAKSLGQSFPGRKMTVVLGTLSIKDFSGIVRALAPLTEQWVATQPKVLGKPSTSPEELAEAILAETPDAKISMTEDVGAAIQLARKMVGQAGIILVTGSLYMLGDARSVWFPVDQILEDLEDAA